MRIWFVRGHRLTMIEQTDEPKRYDSNYKYPSASAPHFLRQIRPLVSWQGITPCPAMWADWKVGPDLLAASWAHSCTWFMVHKILVPELATQPKRDESGDN